MAVRPGQIRYLTKGKLLGAKSHAGFVDTFNWMLSWIYNFRTGPGLSLVGERAGHPRPGPFEPVYANGVLSSLTNCIFCAERQFVDIGDQTVTGSDGYVVLTITHPTSADAAYSTGSVAVENSLPDNANSSVTKIPLYHITNGVIDIDLRAVPTGVLAR